MSAGVLHHVEKTGEDIWGPHWDCLERSGSPLQSLGEVFQCFVLPYLAAYTLVHVPMLGESSCLHPAHVTTFVLHLCQRCTSQPLNLGFCLFNLGLFRFASTVVQTGGLKGKLQLKVWQLQWQLVGANTHVPCLPAYAYTHTTCALSSLSHTFQTASRAGLGC